MLSKSRLCLSECPVLLPCYPLSRLISLLSIQHLTSRVYLLFCLLPAKPYAPWEQGSTSGVQRQVFNVRSLAPKCSVYTLFYCSISLPEGFCNKAPVTGRLRPWNWEARRLRSRRRAEIKTSASVSRAGSLRGCERETAPGCATASGNLGIPWLLSASAWSLPSPLQGAFPVGISVSVSNLSPLTRI